MRRAARACLTALLLGMFGLTAWQGWHLATGWPGVALVDRAQDEIAVAIDRALARHATPPVLDARLAELLAEDPRNWMAIEAVEEVAIARGHDFPDALAAHRAALHAQDTGFLATSAACAACAWDPKACDFSAILFCRAPVDLTPIGDIAGVLREGGNIALGREVDEVDLALSVVGLAAVALAPFTGGGSATIKVGAGMGKTAWRMGRLSEGLTTHLRRAAREGVDWGRIGDVRLFSRHAGDDFAGLVNRVTVKPALDLASDAGRMHDVLGARRTLYLLSRAESGAEARRLANVAEATGPRSLGALETLGKSRVLRATVRWSDEVWFAFKGLMGLIAALVGLFWNLIGSVGLRSLRRFAR